MYQLQKNTRQDSRLYNSLSRCRHLPADSRGPPTHVTLPAEKLCPELCQLFTSAADITGRLELLHKEKSVDGSNVERAIMYRRPVLKVSLELRLCVRL